jgi:CubicO group peptidase (beta-lactamase class C family)
MLQPTLARILFAPISLYLSFRAVWSPPADVLSLKMDRFIDSVIEEWHSVGLGVAVVRLDGHGIWRVETRGYGKATEAGDAMTDESLWPLASNSKVRSQQRLLTQLLNS